ncbi:hypothetical protein SUGI_0941230 [Cryptomeria japonica]|uniref:pentatricopeptide repeat-containing protein At3g26782, mitochondrial-like n=1 Tax=Cryptomeria japonica TaxID=3369 RepID=UPI002414B84C|nr:pentatricopeptide repeat-containing protein At3g26782, mitochondrial-like [Cryptomeria japonica]GLJ44760.1 hypothetical protein SUGI_0941230 [Cryptomeria japonica]
MSSISHFNLNIRALCKEGRLKEALHVLFTTQKPPVDSSTYLHLLNTCVAKDALSEGKRIHSHINESGVTFTADTFLQNKVINLYDKCGSLVDARHVFDHMTEPDVFSWNMIIAAYKSHGFTHEALALFHKMLSTGVQPDGFTFATILPVCAKMGVLELATDMHQRIIESGILSDVVVTNALIDMYVKCGKIHKACDLFDKMLHPNVISWTTMVAGYVQNGLGRKAVDAFKQMQLGGVKPNSATFASVISACAKLGALEQGMEVQQRILKSGFFSHISVANALMDMYAKCGNIKKAQSLFDKMPRRDLVSWNTIISGYAQNWLAEKALKIFKQMRLTNLNPNSATFVSILPACAKFGAVEQGMEIHQRITKSGFLSEVVIANALVNMYAKCGIISKARRLFDKMRNANLVSWTAMIAGYAMHGCSKDALELFEQMKFYGHNPDHISLVCVLFACSHAGLVDEGCKYFSCMSDSYCITPTLDHYVCMVDLLGRAGYLQEALNFVVKMPVKLDVFVWLCLLSACRSEKNIRLGEFVATLLFELEYGHNAPYVLLSNIYAEAGRWADVKKVRKLMKDRGVKKIPGCSWIEVDKMVHAFCIGDRSHPQTQEIYAKLEILSWEMKAAGYIPDTRFVLNDVEEEDKEFLLCHHSEKLAITFGLLNMAAGTTIRVVKNLRVCRDCHTASKFISKIVAREIVVRDANRFHHFKHGQCSCGDYW